MIYTITFNPALDYITQVENFKIGKINRTKAEKILPGGKGLNVSIVLNNLKIKNTAIAFIGGFTGEELKNKIENYGIGTDFIKVTDGITRINIKINSDEETAINGQGPQIMEKEIKELLEKIDKMKNNDIVVISFFLPFLDYFFVFILSYLTCFYNSFFIFKHKKRTNFLHFIFGSSLFRFFIIFLSLFRQME